MNLCHFAVPFARLGMLEGRCNLLLGQLRSIISFYQQRDAPALSPSISSVTRPLSLT